MDVENDTVPGRTSLDVVDRAHLGARLLYKKLEMACALLSLATEKRTDGRIVVTFDRGSKQRTGRVVLAEAGASSKDLVTLALVRPDPNSLGFLMESTAGSRVVTCEDIWPYLCDRMLTTVVGNVLEGYSDEVFDDSAM